MTKIHATGFEDDIEEDRPTLYVTSGGAGNVPGMQEVRLSYVDTAEGIDITLGLFPVQALRDALNALDHNS